ncbi:hypothetical protein [Sphingomonas sp. Leaf4]|uniref:hypothetical protein n=1 Tax=Sphingomonas sp. Leaf4 TaxID=2876553 RepID=UPI001E36B233|nr:hypothetical protein [Sphingomonas sp. Leaf4]
MMRRARRAALAALGQDEHGPEPEDDATDTLHDLTDRLSHALIMAGARDWDASTVAVHRLDDDGNIVLGDDNHPVFDQLPFSSDALARLLADPVIFDAFDNAYVLPFAQRERAKNGFAASPTGTGAAATQASDIVSLAAMPGSTDGAKPAPIVPKRRKTRKPKASGTS